MYISGASCIALLVLTLSDGAVVSRKDQLQRFTIHLPQEIKPEIVTMKYGIYGDGLTLSGVKMQVGVYDYSLELAAARSLRLLIYCPGYKMVSAEFKISDLATQPFVPSLEKLPTTRLKGRLVESSRQGLAGRTLFLSYSVLEAMRYFNYMDGSVPVIEVTSAMTDTDGGFVLEVPVFPDDPFFQNAGYFAGEFRLSLRSRRMVPDDSLRPNHFVALRILGHVGPRFRREVGHRFRTDVGHLFRPEVGHLSRDSGMGGQHHSGVSAQDSGIHLGAF